MPDMLTAERLVEIRRLLEDAPDYLIPHMPQPNGGALLCDGEDSDLGELYDTSDLMPLVELLAGLPQTIGELLSHIDAQQFAVEQAEREQDEARDNLAFVDKDFRGLIECVKEIGVALDVPVDASPRDYPGIIDSLRAALATAQAENRALRERVAAADLLDDAVVELLETARLRGDNDLPHPSDDPKSWTARMQEAWDETDAALDAYRAQQATAHDGEG